MKIKQPCSSVANTQLVHESEALQEKQEKAAVLILEGGLLGLQYSTVQKHREFVSSEIAMNSSNRQKNPQNMQWRSIIQ